MLIFPSYLLASDSVVQTQTHGTVSEASVILPGLHLPHFGLPFADAMSDIRKLQFS